MAICFLLLINYAWLAWLLVLGSLSKSRLCDGIECHQTRALMSKTIAVHTHFESWYFFLLSSGKQQRQMTSTMYFREHKPQWSFLKQQWSRTGEILFTPPRPLSFLLPITHPLGRTFFLFQVFHCMKNSRWWPNFLWCERSLKEISPALQAIWHIFISLCFHINYSNFWIP